MNYQIFFKNEAKLDLIEAINWYESIKSGLGKVFLAAVRTKIRILGRQPELFQIRYDAIRTINLANFPI